MPLEPFGQIIDASAAQPDEIAEAVARVVFSGGTVIVPNDTSYLLGCDPYDYEAIDRVYAAIGRPDNRPLTMHVATAQEFWNTRPITRWRSWLPNGCSPPP